MRNCILWFDNNDREFYEKLARAISYYEQKYGETPTVCRVHPSMIPDDEAQMGSEIRMIADNAILPQHFWLGMD